MIFLFFLALLFFALAWMAVLPPYEGMDEMAHYASIRQIAERGKIPFPGQSFLAQETIDYIHVGPSPYKAKTEDISYDPPRPQFDGLSYPSFFSTPDLASLYKKKYQSFGQRPPYAPSAEENWESQHPPLYYLVMAPIMKATDFLSFKAQFLVLRFASFLLAISGILIGLRATLARPDLVDHRWIIRGYLLYPLLVPIFIQEFARLGNDSLCLLLTGLLWSCFLRWMKDETNTQNALRLGGVLGLGLLTKALFLPLLMGFGGFLAFHAWRDRSDASLTKQRIEAIKAFMLPVILGGLWYVAKFNVLGVISGSVDEVYLAHHGGFLHDLSTYFTWPVFGRNWLITLTTWFWSGTASHISFERWLTLPFACATLFVFGLYAHDLLYGKLPKELEIQAWLYGALFSGLFYYELVCVALDGADQTPGWYLNIMIPFAAPLYALSLQAMWRQKALRLLCKTLLFYALCFIICNVWADMTLYAACSVPDPASHYSFSSAPACLNQTGLVMARLQILGWPKLFGFSLLAGMACLAGMLFYSKEAADSHTQPKVANDTIT